jgi:hypothetical protein
MRMILLLFTVLGVASCGKQGRAIKLANTAYYFPGPHISAITDPEDSGSGQYYIRLIPPGGYYWLVYAPSKESRPSKQAAGVPTIAHINDYPTEIEVTRNAAGTVVCQKNPVNDQSAYMRLIFSCGFRVYDNGVAWSVIIPGDLLASAPALKGRALITLADYRADPRARNARKP